VSFLIVRPKEKAQSTRDVFVQAGLSAQALAIIDIQVSTQSSLTTRLTEARPKYIIVTSTYAVKWLLANISNNQITLNFAGVSFVCVGKACSKMLAQHIETANIYTANPENSEGILQAPCLQTIENHSVILLKGEGGRDLIEQKLGEKQTNLTTLSVYKRVPNIQSISGFTFEPSPIRCIISTSIEITALLLTHVDKRWLASCTWIVASERIKEYANKNGIQHIIVSQGASNKALLACANQIVKTGVVHD
jgi:uroporphyrinogen-III synthase